MDMYRQRSKRAQQIRFLLTYTLVPMLIVVVVTVFVLLVLGYRFDSSDNSVRQGGLVQYDTVPGGARVTVDGVKLGGTTRTRENIAAGPHIVSMTRQGYLPWQKTVTVESGIILWLTYPRLVPQELTSQTLYDYETLAHTISHPGERLLGIQPLADQPTLIAIQADNGDAVRSESTIPVSVYETDDKTPSEFAPRQWSESARYVLFRQTSGDKATWLMLDRDQPEKSININRIAGIPIDDIVLSNKDERYAYILSQGVIRRLSFSDSTLSAPLARSVGSMKQSLEGVISYTTLATADAQASVGYVTPGASQGRSITLPGVNNPQMVRIAEFDRHQYVAVTSPGHLDVFRISLHPSDSDASLEARLVSSVSIAKQVSELSFSPNGRFVVAREAQSTKVYDIELRKVSTITLRSSGSAGTTLRWIDDFHMLSSYDGTLQMHEFDGENVTPLVPATPGTDAILTSNGRYMYYIAPSKDKGYLVERVQMIL